MSNLPLSILIPVMILTIIVLGSYVWKVWNEQPRKLSVGYLMLVISAIFGVLYKIFIQMRLLNHYQWIFLTLTLISLIISIVLIMIGTFNKVTDLSTRKLLKIILGVVASIMLLSLIFVLIMLRLSDS